MTDNELIKHILDFNTPLSEAVLTWLESDITKWDCENWSADVGNALLTRLRELDKKV